jgi:transketolase
MCQNRNLEMPEKAKSTRSTTNELDLLSINTIRMLSADAVERANSGHPGAPMGVAPMAYALWTRYLKHNPADPGWPDRDRFVLSMGHASMLIYSMLHLTGYALSLEDLKDFRQWGSRTPGHPEFGHTPGVETTTGPLGQGVGNAVGLALAERLMAASYNEDGYPLFDHFTYAFCSDGDLMEGVASEAASLAGHLKLGKLICLYDDNRITIDGSTDLSFSEDVGKRFRAYGWHVVGPIDGGVVNEVDGAIRKARRADRPSLIICRTTIAEGSPNKANTAGAHGAPLGAEELRLTKKNLGWPQDESFHVPHQVSMHMSALETGARLQRAWVELLAKYAEAHPEKAARLQRDIKGELPADWEQHLPVFEAGSKAMATRVASGKIINALAPVIENLVGGSADLSPSNMTYIEVSGDQSADNPAGRNLRFGVREHGMGAIINGLLLHGGLRAYGGTFLIFSDYMRPSIRLAALMGIPAIYIFTHDSVGLGEDGPTHQPIEHTMSLRLMPGLSVIRPADPNETSQAWRMALERTDGPTALLLTRQNVPVLDPARTEGTVRGGYVLSRTTGAPRVVLIATGSEVQTALEAKAMLEADSIATQVVSLPCWDVFQRQPAEYIEEVIPTGALPVAIEAGVTLGWERWTGGPEYVQGIDRFGASAPAPILFTELGITAEALTNRVRKHLEE